MAYLKPRSEVFAPADLKTLFGIRFHHFLTKSGRLIATIASEPFDEAGLEIAVGCAVCAAGDTPSRARGRQIALGRIEVGKGQILSATDLKSEITSRAILARFLTDKTATRLGYGSVGDLIADLRPRVTFVAPAEAA